MDIREDERQVLITLIELSEPIETENNTHYRFYPTNLEEALSYFCGLKEDWSGAYAKLLSLGALTRDGDSFILTEKGRDLARQERLSHPPLYYWYRVFYPAAACSEVNARFCEKLYGKNFYQAGFSDLDQISRLIQVGKITPASRVLDLGCGLGGVAEFISDQTGAQCVGVDYVPEAVHLACERTVLKRNRLDFCTGNLDHLETLEGKWNQVISIDTLYMPGNLGKTLLAMKDLLAPGGQLLIFYSHFLMGPGGSRDDLEPGGNALGLALANLGWSYKTWDFSETTFHLMRRKHQLALEMAKEFILEGSEMLLNFILNESDPGKEPFQAQNNKFSRFLYQVES